MKGDLQKASKLYKRAKYPQVIRLLEPQIFRYRQNFDYFYLLGMSCLHTGDLGGANTYLQRGLGIKPNETKANLGLALVHLRRQDIQEAIRSYLEVLEAEPGNKIANRGLAILRKDASPARIQELHEAGKLSRLMPDRRSRVPSILLRVAAVTAAAAIVVFALWYTGVFDNTSTVREPAVEMMSLESIENIVDFSGEYRYLLTEKEIEDTFADVKELFSDYRDNLARREINRLLGSNASPAVKERANIIAGYITTPDFTTIRNPFDYELVAADPFLYNETYVVWKGKLTNLSVTDESITFDLLVGYETNQVLLGVVPVLLEFSAFLEVGDPLEVLGRVKLAKDEGFFIEAVSIHKLQPGSSK